MLQAIRDRAQGWIAWAIVILLTIPFALWGIQEYLGVGSEPVVASIDGQEITERDFEYRYQQFRRNLRERLGGNFDAQLFDDQQMRRDVLNELIREAVIRQAALAMDLRAGDEMVRRAIRSVAAFQRNGQFDNETYERTLRLQGLAPAAFEQQIRSTLIANQLSRAITATAFATGREIDETMRLLRQQRELAYFRLPAADFAPPGTPDDDAIEAYYAANAERYRAPERVRVEYILLDDATIGGGVEPSEADIEAWYQAHQESYGRPEQRRASHILIVVPPEADAAAVDAARKRLDEARVRIGAGEPFAEVAKELSEDPGSVDAGGDLGYFEPGIMDPAFEEAVYGLQLGELSEPVRSAFGLHLIQLTGIREGSVKPLAEVRDEIIAAMRRGEAERLYFEYAERLSDLAFEESGSLAPAAEALGIPTRRSDWLLRDGNPAPFDAPKAIAAAFSEDVLRERHNSELIELGNDRALVLRVIDHEESHVRPLAEVREQVVDALGGQRAADAAAAAAAERVSRIAAGESIDAAAEGQAVERPGAVRRDDAKLPGELVVALFKAPRPEGDRPVVERVALESGDQIVFQLLAVSRGPAATEEEVKAERRALARLKGDAEYDALVAALEQRASVERSVTGAAIQ